mmetsp:Transcript_55454/g.135865  ORF Transcript_55454/g.135865 Transcript_55454/m.135865 type:complete len:96 (-) Transcript_55454:1405-1692(-)
MHSPQKPTVGKIGACVRVRACVRAHLRACVPAARAGVHARAFRSCEAHIESRGSSREQARRCAVPFGDDMDGSKSTAAGQAHRGAGEALCSDLGR